MRHHSRLLLSAAAFVALLLPADRADAQGPSSSPAAPAAPARRATGDIRGRIVVAGSGQPVTSGSITVLRAQNVFAGGALPRPDGSFVVDGIAPGSYTVRVRAIGYAPVLKTGVVISPAAQSVDLGTIELSPAVTQLERQTVVAEAAAQQLSPEKNSYNVKAMAGASGGTAVDALRNVPAVEVDGSNVISLRGNSNVVIQINGRTSPLRGEQLGNFLAQLPSSSVQNIEVATSPSAKDDPEGTAGIINLVLAQPTQASVSGGLNASTGTTGLANVSGNIGKQTDKWTLFASASGFRDARHMEGWADRTLTGGAARSYSNSAIDGRMQPNSGNVMLRSEYKRSKVDAFSFDAMSNMGKFSRDITSDFATLDTDRDTTGAFRQSNDGRQRNFMQDYTAAWRRTGPPVATTWTTQLRFTQFQMNFNSLRLNDLTSGTMVVPSTERNGLRVRFPSWALQGDLVKPFGPAMKLETGLKATLRTLNSRASADTLDSGTSEWEQLAGRNYGLRYEELIPAGYVSASRRVGKAQLMGGLRGELTDTRLELPVLPEAKDRSYASLFPNATAVWNLSEMRSVRLGYSRRISRPDAPQLDPSPFYEDARTVFRGNPQLDPEYTDAYELTVQDARSWGSVQVNPYVRRTHDAIRQIRTVNDEGVTLSTFANVAQTRTMGTDVNASVRRGPLNLNLGGGVFHYESEFGALSTETMAWNARSNASWKITKSLDLQAMANYRAPQKVEGGTQLSTLMTNFALRHKLWGEQGSITLRVADPFATARFATRVRGAGVIEETDRYFGMRGVFVAFQRNFGQAIRLRPPAVDPGAAPGGGLPGGPPGGGN